MKKYFFLALAILTLSVFDSTAQEKAKLSSSTVSAMKFRAIGPALTSGRIADFAVNPNNSLEYYVAVASGNVWKTTNGGVTYDPIFENYGSYSIGCVTMDPSNSNTIWVGTGENNNQRSVAYGDGVYVSRDAGKSFKNVGLKNSEHIGTITVHPTNSNIVYVAAYGPLWKEGGDRGVYKTTDGGTTWNRVLNIDEHTGFNEVLMDPRNPNVLYAAAHQRRRHVYTYISGGPGSGVFKSTDGGASWDTLKTGLPSGDLGRIGLAISPANPDYIYAIIEASDDKDGLYRSTDRGVSFNKQSGTSTSGNYYQEIIPDPLDADKIYLMDTYGKVSTDGGKSFSSIGNKNRHVDDHALWIDPNNTEHLLIGCDGGIYETFDNANSWHFKENLSVTQFYKVAVDNALPFYNVYGGTQDNFSLGGPSRTTSENGISNYDWFVTNGGDGFESQVDPTNPNIVYAQSQYGGLTRYDKKSGEGITIRPMEKEGEAAYRYNWDAPLLISYHNPKKLYFAANRVFMTENRGDSWKTISPDLSRQIDRNKLPVMGKVWGMDAVMKNMSTSIYGNIVAMDESHFNEGELYVGTDDGLIQTSRNGGQTWTKQETFPGIPAKTYVNMLLTSKHNKSVVYAVFNNHKEGDFKPYVLKSTDGGLSWKSIISDLPERGSVYAIAEDHKDPNLLFAGTEFGVFYSNNGGAKWIQLKAGLPTIAIRDIAIQERENDLVLASFGRGFYVLDDYSPLRSINEELLEKEAAILPIKDGLLFIPSSPLGGQGNAYQGASRFYTSNPEAGVTITYHIKESEKTLKSIRKEKEKKLKKSNEPIPYPSFEEMRAEDNEEKAFLIAQFTDSKGDVVARVNLPAIAGIHRMEWNCRYPTSSPLIPGGNKSSFARYDVGPFVVPGTYNVQLFKVDGSAPVAITDNVSFNVNSLNNSTLPATDKEAALAFADKVNEFRKAVSGTMKYFGEMENRVDHIFEALKVTPNLPGKMYSDLNGIKQEMQAIEIAMRGDKSVESRQFEMLPSVNSRMGRLVYNLYFTTSAPPADYMENYEIASKMFSEELLKIKTLDKVVSSMETILDQNGVPYTPGRLPVWK
ncbi:MAG: photosystem II stability/assembly factor-like uncharacterized protein [Sphingobacteriales bacterium]|jgi:photosystem II stability/assembly factor-like uncharacterized protein